MGYDIPQELKYKEIFAYGMTLKQFLYIVVFGVAAVMIISQKGVPQEAGIVVGLALVGTAVLLGFFDFDRKILEFLSFLNAPKNLLKLDKKTSERLGIKYLKDSAIVLKDGTLLGIVQTDAINFSILSKEQKEAVIYNFMSFLNSLGFRTVIMMRTITVDMSKYLQDMGLKTRRKVGTCGMLALKNFLGSYLRSNNVTDRVFYVIVPLKNTCGHGKEHLAYRELEERLAVLQEWLAKSLLNSKRLNNDEILGFLALFLRDDVVVRPESTSQQTLKGGIQ